MKINVTPALFFGFFGFGMVFVGMLGNLLYAIDDAGVQGTVFEEATLVYIAYGAALGAMGALVHWAPKLWGREISGKAAIPLAFLGVAATVLATFPLYIAGLLDQPAGVSYDNDDLQIWNIMSLVGHGLMAITALAFVGADAHLAPWTSRRRRSRRRPVGRRQRSSGPPRRRRP